MLARILPSWLAVPAAVLLLCAAGCGSPAAPEIPEGVEFGGPEFSAIVLSSDLAVGADNRLSFSVVHRDGPPVTAPTAQVRTYLWDGAERQLKGNAVAEFQSWFDGAIGVFLSRQSFDTPGVWELEADLMVDGAPIKASAKFPVKETADTPNVGDPAPASVTLTADDVPELGHLSSAPQPNPAFYRVSVHQALASAKPFVLVFATPAFCISATCGPQLQELAKVQERYAGRANFIHVEVLKDPHLFQGIRPTEDELVPAVSEWGLPTEPWTFVVDAQGRVADKYEHFTPASAIEAALLEALEGP